MNPEGSLQAVWMLPCATCLSSFSRVVLEHFCDSGEAYSFYVESIGLLKSKSITLLIFFCLVLQILWLSYHRVSRWRGIKWVSCFLYLGFCTE